MSPLPWLSNHDLGQDAHVSEAPLIAGSITAFYHLLITSFAILVCSLFVLFPTVLLLPVYLWEPRRIRRSLCPERAGAHWTFRLVWAQAHFLLDSKGRVLG